MTDKQYKRRELIPRAPANPSGWNVRGGAPFEGHWFAKILRAQDTMLESARRVVASRHMGGQVKAWLVPETDPDAAAQQDYPDRDDDREIARHVFNLAPGSMLEARCLYLPSSPTHFQNSLWYNEGNQGETRWNLTWDLSGQSDTSIAEIFQEGSQLQYGKQAAGINGAWPSIRHGYQASVVPAASWLQDPTATKWSEWARVIAVQNDRGGTRTIHATLSEVPRLYVDDHDNSGEASAHVYASQSPHPDIRPKTDTADGATYEDHRFGVLRGLDVARRQADRMGPIVFHWSAFFEGDGAAGTGGNPGAVDTASYPPAPYTNGSSTPTCLWHSGIAAWSAAAPGFCVPGGYAKRWAENDPEQILPGGSEACLPVRIRIWAKMSSGTGYVAVQSTDRSRIIKSITGSSFAWHTVTGFLECGRSGIDTGVNAMAFGYQDGGGGTLSVQDVCVEMGDFSET